MLITGSDQLEEVMSLLGREPGVADFINDQQAGRDVATQPLTHEARVRGALQRLREFRQRRKQDRMSLGQRPISQREAQVRLTPSIKKPS